jgi:hypothetical protein
MKTKQACIPYTLLLMIINSTVNYPFLLTNIYRLQYCTKVSFKLTIFCDMTL